MIRAREHQLARNNCDGGINARLNNAAIERICKLLKQDQALLRKAVEHFRLSARAYHRILRVARTIADLDGSDQIATAHLAEAISYRCAEK